MIEMIFKFPSLVENKVYRFLRESSMYDSKEKYKFCDKPVEEITVTILPRCKLSNSLMQFIQDLQQGAT